MAVSYVTVGTMAVGGTSGTVSPAAPATIAAGDLLVLVVGCKPYSDVANTPSGWTSQVNIADGTTASTLDNGSTRLQIFTKVADGTEDGATTAVTFTPGTVTQGSTWAYIVQYANANGVWSLGSATGTDTVADTSWSITFGSNPGITSGDQILLSGVNPSDNTTTWSLGSLAATGATFSALTIVADPRTNQGDDTGGHIDRTDCSAGTASAAAVWTRTLSLSTSKIGPGGLLRIREAAAPGAPTSLTLGTATDTTQPLSWTAPASDGGSALTDYIVQYAIASSGSWNTFAEGTSTTASATVTGLSPHTSYDYRVAAVNAVGTGANSSTATGSTANTVPGAPTALTLGTATTTTQPLSWTAPADNGGSALTDYVIQYAIASSGSWSTFADATSTTASTTVTGLSANTDYDYRVAAVNAVGTGANSSTATGSTASGGGGGGTIVSVQSASRRRNSSRSI